MIALFTKRWTLSVDTHTQHTQYTGHQLRIQTHQKLPEYKLNITQSACSQSLVRVTVAPRPLIQLLSSAYDETSQSSKVEPLYKGHSELRAPL